MATTPATVGGKALALRYTNRAQYRLQTLGLVSDLADIFDDKKRVAGVCNWLWAMDNLTAYASPEAVADALTSVEVAPAIDALLAAFRAAHPDAAPAEKKSPAISSRRQKRGLNSA